MSSLYYKKLYVKRKIFPKKYKNVRDIIHQILLQTFYKYFNYYFGRKNILQIKYLQIEID